MRYTTFRNILLASGLVFLLSLGYCTCHSSSTPAKNTATVSYVPQPVQAPVYVPAPVQQAPVYVPTPAPAPVYQASTPTTINIEQLRTDAQNWLQNNPRSSREMRRQTNIDGVRVTAIRFPANDARKFTDNEADWSQLRFDFNGDGRDDEKWLIKNGTLSKRERLGSDGRTVIGDPIYFN